METFVQWLQGEDRSAVNHHRQEIVSPDATTELKETPQPETPQRSRTLATDDDLVILKQEYGELTPGLTIRLELNNACELLGRTRRRVDAFKLLQKRLKDEYGVQLIIYSRKTHE